MSLWWGWEWSSVVPGEKDSGLHAELFVLQGEKVPRQVGLHAELFVLLIPRKIPRQVGLHAEIFVLENWTPVLKPI